MQRLSAARRLYACTTLIGLSLALSVQLSGCSLLGLAGGAAIDATRPKTKLLPTGEVRAFRKGDSLHVYLKDSSAVGGRYAGGARMSDADYRARCEAAQLDPGAPRLPLPGDAITIVRAGRILGGTEEGTFIAFSNGAVEFRDRRDKVRRVEFHQLREIGFGAGTRHDRGVLERLRTSGALPLVETFSLATDAGPRTIALSDIAFVWGPTTRTAARRGFVLGLTADALIVATVVAMAASYRGPFDGASCDASPGLYSARMERRVMVALAAAPAEKPRS